MDCPPSPLHAQTHLAPAHTNHSHLSSKSSSVTNSHPVIVQSPKSVPLNHSAPVFRPSVHSVTKPTSATHVTTPQKSLDHGCSVIVSPVHNISHPVELSGIQSSFSSSAAYSPSPSTYSASTSTHPHSKKKSSTHHIYSVVSSPMNHSCSTVMSSKTPTDPLSEAIDVFKTGSIFSNSDSLLVAGTLDGVCVDMTVDTGSNISIVRPDVLPKASSNQVQPIPGSAIRTVTGEQAPIIGKVLLQVSIGSRMLPQEFWVADIQDCCILGLDYLRVNNCQVNLREQVLIIGEEEVPLLKHSSKKPGERLQTYRAILESRVTLPPRSESVVPAKVEGLKQGEVKWAIVGPLESNPASAIQDLLVGRALVTLDEPIATVRLMNLSDQARHLRRGTVVAACEPVESVLISKIGDASGDQLPEHLTSLFEKSSEGLTPPQTTQLHDLLCRYASVFSSGLNDLGRTDLVKHHIDTQGAIPVRQQPRRLPFSVREEAQQSVTAMLDQGVIEPSSSPWASPVVLVKKKGGGTRFCVDYRKLNLVTRKDSYPLPRIDDTLEALAGAEWFSTLDLVSGYWQIELDEESKEKTAFSTQRGLWQFKVMPFGLCNAPATFERLMEQVLAGLPLSVCLLYLDDILVPGTDFDAAVKSLEAVFDRLMKAGLKLSPKKCSLFRREVKFLGHIVSSLGLTMDPDKVKAVQEWPVPGSVNDVRRFLGLCSYYRRFIDRFTDIARPLYQCTEGGTRVFTWSLEAENAFQQLKQALISAPLLCYPTQEDHFVLDTDASGYGVGAVLSQVQMGEERVIAYYSQVLSRPERQYCTTRRELLAVVKAVKHFHPYLYGRSFTLRTDHAALQWLFSFRFPEGQIARWLERLQQYDFRVQHRAGKLHNNADTLSRPCLNVCKHCDRLEAQDTSVCKRELLECPSPSVATVKLQKCAETSGYVGATRLEQVIDSSIQLSNIDILQAQEEDDEIGPIIQWRKESETRPGREKVSQYSEETKLYWAQWDSLRVRDGLLYREWEAPSGEYRTLQLFLPKQLRTCVLHSLHNTPAGWYSQNIRQGERKVLLG